MMISDIHEGRLAKAVETLKAETGLERSEAARGGFDSDSLPPFENLVPIAIVAVAAKAPRGRSDQIGGALHSVPWNGRGQITRRGGMTGVDFQVY